MLVKTLSCLLVILVANTSNGADLSTPRPPESTKPETRRKQHHISSHNQEGQPIPIEMDHTWDRCIFQLERDVASQSEQAQEQRRFSCYSDLMAINVIPRSNTNETGID